MKEESKEEYLARHRKERGLMTEPEPEPAAETKSMKERLKGLFFLLLFAAFIYAIYQIFGMLKSN